MTVKFEGRNRGRPRRSGEASKLLGAFNRGTHTAGPYLPAAGSGEASRRAKVFAFLREHVGEPWEAEIADPTGTLMAGIRHGLVLAVSPHAVLISAACQRSMVLVLREALGVVWLAVAMVTDPFLASERVQEPAGRRRFGVRVCAALFLTSVTVRSIAHLIPLRRSLMQLAGSRPIQAGRRSCSATL